MGGFFLLTYESRKEKRKPKAGILFNLFMSSCSKWVFFASWNDSRKKTMVAAGWTHGSKEMIQGVQLYPYLGGGFKHLAFSPLLGEDEPNLTSIFFRWVWNHQPDTFCATKFIRSHPEERVGSFASREKVETFMPPLELWNDISKQNRCQWRHIHLFQKTSNRSPLKKSGRWMMVLL